MIRQAIADQPQRAVLSGADFLSAGTRADIDQALFRLVKAGTIVRVANAFAQKTGEHVGLAQIKGPVDVLVAPHLWPEP